MKIKNPIDRNDLSIKRKHRVLEVGGGHNPNRRSQVIVDKFVDSNYHRNGDIKVYKGQQFICADGEQLPFEDGAFDYVICCQVLEHVDDPIKFCKEQGRVAKRGYMETPSLVGEYLMPKESHKWVSLEIEGKIVMFEKEKVNFKAGNDFGYIFLEYLPRCCMGYRVLQRTHHNIFSINYEWEHEIEVVVNPDSSYYRDFFTKAWSDRACELNFPRMNLKQEFINSFAAYAHVCKTAFKSKVLHRFH